MRCLTSNKRWDFGGDPDRDAETGIFKGIFYHNGVGAIVRILLTTREVGDEFLWIHESGGRLTSNKMFDFGGDADP